MTSESVNNKVQIIVRPASTFASGDQQVQDAARALPAIGEALAEPARQFWDGIRAGGSAPGEVEVAFSLAFEGGANWAIVSAGVEATIAVTMKWSEKADS